MEKEELESKLNGEIQNQIETFKDVRNEEILKQFVRKAQENTNRSSKNRPTMVRTEIELETNKELNLVNNELDKMFDELHRTRERYEELDRHLSDIKMQLLNYTGQSDS